METLYTILQEQNRLDNEYIQNQVDAYIQREKIKQLFEEQRKKEKDFVNEIKNIMSSDLFVSEYTNLILNKNMSHEQAIEQVIYRLELELVLKRTRETIQKYIQMIYENEISNIAL